MLDINFSERFWSKVDRSGGPDQCWPWLASTDSNGYGKFYVGGKLQKSPRVAFFLIIGHWPIAALHRCDNAICVNPNHLFEGSQADNMKDMREKGRHSYKAHLGSKNGRAKITESKVDEIRCLYRENNLTQRAIGEMFGLSNQMVSRIIAGLAWKCVRPDLVETIYEV
jgi:hypothetical protein